AEQHDSIMRTGKTIELEEAHPQTDGTTQFYQVAKLPVVGSDGTIIGSQGILFDITLRKQAAEKMGQVHRQLVDASRQAGMAEVATSVLHNVGNVLNSVNVSSSLIAERLKNSKVGNLSKSVAMLNAHEADLANFLTNDPKGKQLTAYLS